MQNTRNSIELPARTHAHAAAQFRRPFAPGAIGFRAMMKVRYNGEPESGATVAAYLGAQSVLQRLNTVVPGRWRMEFTLLKAPAGAKKRYMACKLIIALPAWPSGRDVEAVYEDVGELEASSRAGLKALYSDARKRAAVAAGVGAYLYTALQPAVLPIGPEDHQVQAVPRPGGEDLLVLSPATEQWLREDYARQVSTDAVRRDLGEVLAHGEPERGGGQGEAAEEPAPNPVEAGSEDEPISENGPTGAREPAATTSRERPSPVPRKGVVVVEFGGRGPDAA